MAASLKFSMSDKDFGYKHLVKQVKELGQKPYVKVGVQGSEAKKTKKGSDGDVDLVAVAMIHEFGTEDIPRRSFIEWPINESEDELFALKAKLLGEMLDASKRLSVDKALGLIGQRAMAIMRGYFTSNSWEDLSEATLARRRSKIKGGKANDSFSGFHPLIDSGQLRASITYVRVTNGRK